MVITILIPISLPILNPLLIEKKIDSIIKIPLFYGEYFISNNYNTFGFEIFISILFIVILFIISKLFMSIVSKKNVDLQF